MPDSARYKIPVDYCIIFAICASFILIALFFDSPRQILLNLYKINISRSVLVTDYVALAGMGAALANAAFLGLFHLLLLIISKRESSGKIIAALFVTIGFSLFGKNLFNMFPIMVGVWLHVKFFSEKKSDMPIYVMFSGTIAPLVSEIAFLNESTSFLRIAVSYGVGLFAGFIFPAVTEAVKRMHRGYCLYNGGIAGGFIATFFVGVLRSVGIEILPENFWDTSNSVFLASLSYAIAAALILYGVLREGPGKAVKHFMQLLNEKDVNDNNYLSKYGSACYLNIGLMCVIATSLMLFLKIPINGPVLGGILTVTGFGAAGKHAKNTLPILLGSIGAAYFNHIDLATSMNALAILFSTGLAPVSGKRGWHCGIITGFLHVSVAIFIGQLNGGLNLYNNGFAGGFVVITVVPAIVCMKELYEKFRPPAKINEGDN